ncbi:Hypothetical protein PHPALM_17336 [Phytophthora palmivora]|uniref:Uncharacterized protein n=1 Tax=Phytophthora palmivora TaxID=4796 RepID=A0A2P4XMH0_9STRA|nr:Hypothetical protein PHPALM_17336 [Phytophthora palmivora]
MPKIFQRERNDASDTMSTIKSTDRFYTAVQLTFQLVHRNIYSIDTIMCDKVEYPQEIGGKPVNRPKRIAHGTVRFTVAGNCPMMTGLVCEIENLSISWGWDPVERWRHVVQRRTRGSRGVRHAIPCPSMIRGYHQWMGGVPVVFTSLFNLDADMMQEILQVNLLGVCGCDYFNAYVVFRETQKSSKVKLITHA